MLLALSATSCSKSRVMQRSAPSISEGQRDSLELLAHMEERDPRFGRFPRHHVFLDTLTCNHGVDLIWWDGNGPAPSMELNWKHGGIQDLSVLDNCALQFSIRKKRLSQSTPVLVLGWIDEDGHVASIHLNQYHLLNPDLDTLWQTVNVPIEHFRRGSKSTDFKRIAGLQLTLEDFGEVLIDEMTIGPSLPSRKANRRARKADPSPCPKGKFNVFEDQFDHVWGLGDFGDRRIMKVSAKRGRNKSNTLELEWNFIPKPFSTSSPSTDDNMIGFTWNGWCPVSPPSNLTDSKIEFHLKNIGVNPGPSGDLPITIGIVDHFGYSSEVSLSGNFFANQWFGHWEFCSIPLSEFDWKLHKKDPPGLSSIQYITISTAEKGHVFIDDIDMILTQ